MSDSEGNMGIRSFIEKSSSIQYSSSVDPSPFDKLATETIAQIFENACPNVDLPGRKPDLSTTYRPLNKENTDPWILSTVCRRWRNITIAYHSLWATIIIESSRIHGREWIRWGFFQLRDCLNRSGSHPLKIRITGSDRDGTAIFNILDLVMVHGERWNSIGFGFPLARDFLQRFNLLKGRLPLLELLDIDLSTSILFEIGGPQLCAAFLSTPALSRLCIRPFFGMKILRSIQIPWTQISEVTFSSNDFRRKRDLYEMLEWLSVSLTALIFWNALETSTDYEFWRMTKPINLTKLRRLIFGRNCRGILDMLVCPSLDELDIETGDEVEINRFLDSSSCALTHIRLGRIRTQGSYDNQFEYCAILQKSSLSTLKSISLAKLTYPILDLLTFDSRGLLPFLETLRLHLKFARREGLECLVSRVDSIRKVVEGRTHAIPSNHREASMDGLLHSLNNLSLTFDLGVRAPEMNGYWDETSLQELRLFCISRNISVQLEIFHSSDYFLARPFTEYRRRYH